MSKNFLFACISIAAASCSTVSDENNDLLLSNVELFEIDVRVPALEARAEELALFERTFSGHTNWEEIRERLFSSKASDGWIVAFYADHGELNYLIRGFVFSNSPCQISRVSAVSNGESEISLNVVNLADGNCDIPGFWRDPEINWNSMSNARELSIGEEPTRILFWGNSEASAGRLLDFDEINQYYNRIFFSDD